MTTENHVCPVERAGALENNFRRFLQNPEKILTPFVRPGMTALDIGCGPGFFSVAMSDLVGKKGKVLAVDLQQDMLDIISRKIANKQSFENIKLQLCTANSISVNTKVDFALCFYMVHEVPDRKSLLSELADILKPDGKLLIVEPKFHVNKKAFHSLILDIEKAGFFVDEKPNVFFSRAVVCKLQSISNSEKAEEESK